MVLTVNMIGNGKVLAVCNMTLDTFQTEDVIRKEYEDVLQHAFEKIKGINGNAADVMQTATEMVMEKYPDMVLISVNDERQRANPKNSINLNFSRH